MYYYEQLNLVTINEKLRNAIYTIVVSRSSLENV